MPLEALRLIKVKKDFPWSELTPQLVFILQIATMVRARFDYIIWVEGIIEKSLYFQVRDGRFAGVPGSAEHFMSEMALMTGPGVEWLTIDKGEPTETIVASPRSSSISTPDLPL